MVFVRHYLIFIPVRQCGTKTIAPKMVIFIHQTVVHINYREFLSTNFQTWEIVIWEKFGNLRGRYSLGF